MFLFLWFLVFIFSALCFEFNVISKDLITFFNFVLTLFKGNNLLKYRNRVLKKYSSREVCLSSKMPFIKVNFTLFIYKEKSTAVANLKVI